MVTLVLPPRYVESTRASIPPDGLDGTALCQLMFTLIEHFCAQLPVRRGPGRRKTYSDAVILKLDMLMHLTGKRGETEILREVQRHYAAFFPHLPSQSRLWHRLCEAVPLIERFRQALRQQLGVAAERVRIVDTLPLVVWEPHARVGRGNGFALAEGGYCATKKLKYVGFKLGLLITPQGIPDVYDLFSARWHDLDLLEELVAAHHDGWVLGDKAFISAPKRLKLWQTQRLCVFTYRRANQKERPTPLEHWTLRTFRQTIETVFAQLHQHLHLQDCGAKTDAGLAKRVVGILTAFTLGIYLNALLGRPLLAIKELFA